MKQVLLITATKSKSLQEFEKRPLAKSLKVLCDKRYDKAEFDFEIVKNNSDGLPEVYNRFLTEKNQDKILLFVHDDLEIHDLNLVEKLNESPWDITGLAGGSEFKILDKNLWHVCCPRHTYSGTVSHPLVWQDNDKIVKDNNRTFQTLFGPWPQRCLVLDGLFLAINAEKIIKTGFYFDTRHKFHHYDIASCLLANEKKLKLGTYPIYCFHHGLGDSYMSKEWAVSNENFIKNWSTALKTS